MPDADALLDNVSALPPDRIAEVEAEIYAVRAARRTRGLGADRP
jgi:hypothetical protein